MTCCAADCSTFVRFARACSEDFRREYETAIAGERVAARPSRALPHSLQWLWDSYRQTDNWLRLSATTRYQRENIMKAVLVTSGAEPYAAIQKRHIVAGLDRRAKTPAYARNFFKTMRGLFHWAAEREHVVVDPTASIKAPKPRKGQGFPACADVVAYHKRWPIGTRQRVWIDVLLFTGLRRGDAARVGRQHERDGVVTLRMEKGGEQIVLTLPVLDVLRRTLEAGPTGDQDMRRARRAVRQGELWQYVLGGRARRRCSEVCPWRAQDRGDNRGGERRHRIRTRSHLRMARRSHGGALYASGQPRADRHASDPEIGRNENFYARTSGQGGGARAERPTRSKLIFRDSGHDRDRTCDPYHVKVALLL